MFQSSKNLIRAVLDVVDDLLVGAPELDPDVISPHPHRRPVQMRLQRREGAMTPRTMQCVSPVRSPAQRRRSTAARP